jgi:ubiquitin-activating enzyme E1
MKDLLGCWTLLASLAFLSTVSSKHWGLSRGLQSLSLHQKTLAVGLVRSKATSWETIRGGSTDDDDEERYSRQVYTLGARAHGLVRSSVVYVDGPGKSGLLYECVKNLALSGVGKIVILTSDDQVDSNYHNPQLDDLGRTYVRAARTEVGLENDDDDSTPDEEVLIEFLRRLNPSLTVTSISRSDLSDGDQPSGILLCVDRPYQTQVSLNKLSRKQGFSFVSVETAGVYGRTYCDFGDDFEVHDPDGETALVVPLDHVEILNQDDRTMLVQCVDGERHDVSKGDTIKFQFGNGEMLQFTCSVTHVQNPQRLSIRLNSQDTELEDFVSTVNEKAASFSRVKIPEKVSFLPLEAALKEAMENGALFTPCDFDKSFDESRRSSVFSCFQTLSDFVQTEKRLPTPEDLELFSSAARQACPDEELANGSEWKKHCRLFTQCCAAKFTPLQAIFGAIAAQETLKAASGLYTPIRQFLLYDCDEVLDSSKDAEEPDEKSYTSGQAYILGQKVEDEFKTKKIFVVGAGAIGCEILKNLSAMGAGTGKKGCVVVTDMDTIEKSNLSRQLLFRDSDIGKFKSMAAQEAIRRFNPALKMEAHTGKVGDEDIGPFDSKFWSKSFDIILNALDNVEARLYMDRQCVANQKALVDAGTLGPKGNVQVVVPHQSESYGSSSDPPEPAIPVCTLKNFPYAISHTIQWGRDLFDGLFLRRAKQANEHADCLASMSLEEFSKELIHKLGKGAAPDAATELGEDLATSYEESDIDTIRSDSIDWAIELANKLFRKSVETLLIQHPVGSVDEDGEPFWSGSRKLPKALSFSLSGGDETQQDAINQNLIDFVRNAARLRVETFVKAAASTGGSNVSTEDAKEALQRGDKSTQIEEADGLDKDVNEKVYSSLQGISPGAKNPLYEAEFEKDDDSNGHVAFIAAASNLRAICYGIPPVDVMETRRVAGKIVPAMITTTAFVSAVSCIELIKLIKGVSLKKHRNAFINLALPFFAFTSPLPAEEILGLRGQVYTLWDRISIKEGKKAAAGGGITMRKLLKKLKSKACDDPDSIDIATVSFGQYMIYANFLHDSDDEIMDKNIWELVQESVTSGDEFDNEFSRQESEEEAGPTNLARSSFLDLTVVVEDLETGEEIELPPVRVLKSTS